jgi:hypothetical protein
VLHALLIVCLAFTFSPRFLGQAVSAAAPAAVGVDGAAVTASVQCERERHPAGHHEQDGECCAFCRLASGNESSHLATLIVATLFSIDQRDEGDAPAPPSSKIVLRHIHEGVLTAWAATAPPAA